MSRQESQLMICLAIEEGSYGDGAVCGEPISSKRLRAVPWASNCIRCQQVPDHRTHLHFPIPHWDEAA
ncbi:MAG: TraR/DksA C4-type zinc finger protein [Bryobacteraceae bacterium]|nr:TraR/DksA C4-type zinc finger protein [Bryobacteraceae bacterium]